jgi:hypothetical protein
LVVPVGTLYIAYIASAWADRFDPACDEDEFLSILVNDCRGLRVRFHGAKASPVVHGVAPDPYPALRLDVSENVSLWRRKP